MPTVAAIVRIPETEIAGRIFFRSQPLWRSPSSVRTESSRCVSTSWNSNSLERPARKGEAEIRVEKDEKYWTRLGATKIAAPAITKPPFDFIRGHSRSIKTLVAAWVGQVQMLVQLQEFPQASLVESKGARRFFQRTAI